MATGPAWNIDNPLKPWALFDPSPTTVLVIPVEIDDWLAEMGTSYLSHVIVADAPLSCLDSPLIVDPDAGNVIAIRMKLAATPTFSQGQKYPFTIRLTGANGADGVGPQTDDRTLWLKLKDR